MTERAERAHGARQLRIVSTPVPHKLDQFRCTPMGAWLTREACGVRHGRAALPADHRSRPLDCGTCARCELGSAHGRGDHPSAWPDGTPLETRSIAVAGLSKPPVPGARTIHEADIPRKRKMRHVQEAATYSYGGKTLTLAQWAEEPEVKALGLTKRHLKNRLARNRHGKRMTLERALSQPLTLDGRGGSKRALDAPPLSAPEIGS